MEKKDRNIDEHLAENIDKTIDVADHDSKTAKRRAQKFWKVESPSKKIIREIGVESFWYV